MLSRTADHSKSRLTFTAAAPVSLAQSHGPAVEAMNSLDPVVAKTVAENAVGGVTIGVVVGPSLIWTKSYGDADIERHIRANENTVYRVGSITKQFTAVMLLQLVESGRVHLSDPVEKYFPEVNRVKGRWAGAPPITLFQLATHTAGLAKEPEDCPRTPSGQFPNGKAFWFALSNTQATSMNRELDISIPISVTQY